MRLIIHSLPRSGSTLLYHILTQYFRDHIFLYEPFNDDVIWNYRYNIVKPLHDIFHTVRNDIQLLDHETYNLFINNIWFLDYVQGRKPYCGNWRTIFHRLSRYPNIIIKDLYLWCLLTEKEADNIFHTLEWKHLFIIRDKEEIKNELSKWYLKDRPVWKNTKQFYNSGGVFFHHPDIAYGLNLNHRKLYGEPYPLSEDYSLNDLLNLLGRVYVKYVEIASKHADIVIYYEELFNKQILEHKIKTIAR